MRRTLLNAAIVFALDDLVIGQGFFTGFVPIFVVIGRLVQTARARARGDHERARLLRRRAAVWATVVVVTIVWLVGNIALASRRADTLIAAVRRYEARHQRLPDTLQALVPEFIPAVPRAKYTLLFGDFLYAAGDRRHLLVWVVIPPFMRQLYNFEADRWSTLD